MFTYFWTAIENIPEGVGYQIFSFPHLCEIIGMIAFVTIMTIYYGKQNETKRDKIRKLWVILLLADEAFKHIGLLATHQWNATYLPLHLWSINIFLITAHAFSKNKLLGNFIWTTATIGAGIAIITPTWASLPILNFMHLHSVSVHCLLVCYPIMLMVNGDIVRDYRYMWKVAVMLIGLGICSFPINKSLETNFFFTAFPPEGTPLVLFENWFGNHIWGFVILIPILLFIMYIPFKKVSD